MLLNVLKTNQRKAIRIENLSIELWVMSQWINPQIASTRIHFIWTPVCNPAAPLPTQLPGVSWESSGEWTKALGTCRCVKNLEEAPSSWFSISTAIDLCPFVGSVNEWKTFFSVSLLWFWSAYSIKQNKS